MTRFFDFSGQYVGAWLLCGLGLFAVEAAALEIRDGGAGFSLEVASVKELRFQGITRQQYDFSCGSAALSTLLTHHYTDPTSEEDVFEAMFAQGDQDKIRRDGFSMLDMKDYLKSKGYRADGFRIPVERLIEIGVPAIALINELNYQHFVVIKGAKGQQLLLGDPAKGLVAVSRARFKKMWNGVLFVIRGQKRLAQQHFNRETEWGRLRTAPRHVATEQRDLASFSLLLPDFQDF